MKFVGFIIILLLVGFGFFWKREPRTLHVRTAASPDAGTAVTAPMPAVGSTAVPASPPRASPSPMDDDVEPRLRKIAELSRLTLPTQEQKETLIKALSDRDLQLKLGRILEAGDRLEYDAGQEKQRMDAVSALGLILRYKDVQHREEVVSGIKQRILTVDFDSMKDLRVKQSIYGDITELLMILKHHDPEAFGDMAQRISETNRKVLKTALAASR